jgi:altronate dehydratase
MGGVAVNAMHTGVHIVVSNTTLLLSDHFEGYARLVGRAGIRNYLLILSATGLTGPTARRVHRQLPGSLVICNPVDTGPLGDDREATNRALNGFVTEQRVSLRTHH